MAEREGERGREGEREVDASIVEEDHNVTGRERERVRGRERERERGRC